MKNKSEIVISRDVDMSYIAEHINEDASDTDAERAVAYLIWRGYEGDTFDTVPEEVWSSAVRFALVGDESIG